MKMTKLGHTDLNVSRLCLGTMTWGEQNTEADAHAQMDWALGAGVNFWDTAELYAVPPRAATYGLTETYIGNWFAKTGKRKDVVLASKVAGRGRPYIREGRPISPADMRVALEGSLTRLQTEVIDLYQLHWPNRPYPHHQQHWGFVPASDKTAEVESMHALLQTLGDLVKEGKIRAWGLSNDTPWGVMTYARLAEKFALPKVASVQNEYSLLYRLDDMYMEEVCALENVAYLPYSSLAVGILTGKYNDGAMPVGTRIAVMGGKSARLTDAAVEATKAYMALAAKHGLTPAQLALGWTLARPFVTSTIIGATTMAQLQEDVSAADVVLSRELLAEVEAVRKVWPMPY